MPSALETLVKILKLEKEQGYKNAAVIGGLAAYETNWKTNAHAQARKPEHHALVDELFDIAQALRCQRRARRTPRAINYMLDRIMGRVPAPADYPDRMAARRRKRRRSGRRFPKPPPGERESAAPR